jgi:chromosome segregation ATPase
MNLEKPTRHQLRMYENEFEELNLQLREARENIFKLVEMHSEAIQQRDEAMASLRSKSGEAAGLRKLVYDMDISARSFQREADRLGGILDGLITQPKTII